MKRLKKLLVLVMCVGVLCGMTACSSDKSTEDNMTNTTDEDNVNDATKGKDSKDGDGAVDDVVDDVTDGVDKVTDDVTDGVDNAADEMTDDNATIDDNTTNNQ